MTSIALECLPDEALIKKLGFPKKKIFHHPGKSRVLAFLEKNSQSVGIVDEDPGAAWPRYFNQYVRIPTMCLHDLDYYQHATHHGRLIVVRPRLEEWILKQVQISGIDPEDFSLPAKAKDLHAVITNKIPKFESMLTALLEKDNDGLLHLRELVAGTHESA